MRLWKRLWALILAVTMLLSLSGCGLFGRNFDSILRNGGVKFSEMEYSRPDIEEMRSCVNGIYDLLDNNGSYNDVTAALDEYYELYWSFDTMQTLASIRSDLDTTDEYYAGEYEYCSNLSVEVDNLFDELMTACADSDLSERLDEKYFGGLLAERYSGALPDNLDALYKLYEEENRLLNEYRSCMFDFYAEDDLDAAYAEYNPEACQIYIDLVKVRNEIARTMGCDSYEELAYADFGREYTPDDLKDYLAAVKEYILPLLFKAQENGIIDKAFESVYTSSPEDSLEVVKQTVKVMDDTFYQAMSFMLGSELYDISQSRTKYDDSYVDYIEDYSSPFLFINPTGYEDDILTISHEFGHFTDSYVNYDMDMNLDTSETMSQGLEYLMLCYIEDEELRRDLTVYKMSDVLYLYANQCCFNEFEHRVYSLPENELTVSRVNGIYAELAKEYGFGDDYGDNLGKSWIDITHFFEYPFYVISYCISDSAAFGFYAMEQEQAGSGLEAYLNVLNSAADYDFLALLEDKGIDSPITADTIKTIAETVAEALGL